jgi:hypothetical protein
LLSVASVIASFIIQNGTGKAYYPKWQVPGLGKGGPYFLIPVMPPDLPDVVYIPALEYAYDYPVGIALPIEGIVIHIPEKFAIQLHRGSFCEGRKNSP